MRMFNMVSLVSDSAGYDYLLYSYSYIMYILLRILCMVSTMNVYKGLYPMHSYRKSLFFVRKLFSVWIQSV